MDEGVSRSKKYLSVIDDSYGVYTINKQNKETPAQEDFSTFQCSQKSDWVAIEIQQVLCKC